MNSSPLSGCNVDLGRDYLHDLSLQTTDLPVCAFGRKATIRNRCRSPSRRTWSAAAVSMRHTSSQSAQIVRRQFELERAQVLFQLLHRRDSADHRAHRPVSAAATRARTARGSCSPAISLRRRHRGEVPVVPGRRVGLDSRRGRLGGVIVEELARQHAAGEGSPYVDAHSLGLAQPRHLDLAVAGDKAPDQLDAVDARQALLVGVARGPCTPAMRRSWTARRRAPCPRAPGRSACRATPRAASCSRARAGSRCRCSRSAAGEARLDTLPEVLAVEPPVVRAGPGDGRHLGRQHHRVATALEGPADDLLGRASARACPTGLCRRCRRYRRS